MTVVRNTLGSFKFETCCRCGVKFAMPESLYETALERREALQFYCPNGHHQHYVSGQTEADKLRQERDRLVQNLAWKDDEIRAQNTMRVRAERQAAARKGQITRLKNRAAAGVCPCCNRSFDNLRRHMSSKHPEFTAEEVA